MKNKIAIVGPYPPPPGGISVHIQRMEYFLQESGVDYIIYNHGYTKAHRVIATNKSIIWYFKFLLSKTYRLVHFHQFFIGHFLYYFLFSHLKKSKLVITIHSERILNYNSFTQHIILFLLRGMKNTKVISVSLKLSEFLKKNRVRVQFLPAYVPPAGIMKRTITSQKKLFMLSVWKFTEVLANKIYNVPLALEFLERHKGEYEMLFLIGSESQTDKIYLEDLLKHYKVSEHVRIIYNENLVDYLHNCSFLLRPNTSDGYGVSIQEAMDLGVPAIASDVCIRPKGTVLFSDNNIEDLIEKVKYVEQHSVSDLLKHREVLTYHKQLLDIYTHELNYETSNTEF